jgi:hypothetical protein
MNQEYHLTSNYKSFIMDNIVNDYSMEFEPLTEMVLDKSIAYFQTLKDELVTIKNRSGKEIYDIF